MSAHLRDFNFDPRVLFLCLIASVIGVISTGAAYALLKLIHFFTNLFFFQTFSFVDRSPAEHTLGLWVIAVPVIGGLIAGLISRYGSEKVRGHGIPEAIETILFGKSKMSPKIAVLKPLTSGVVIGSGGPFGAEGPIIMTGGAIGSLIAQHFSLSAAERKTLLVAGATAGMTAVFGTPIAAVLLAVELLLFEWRPRSLLPVLLACAVAAFTRPLLIGIGPLFPLHTQEVGLSAFFICILAGLLSGMLSSLMSMGLYKVEDWYHKLPVHWMWWPAIGGLVVGIGGYFQPRALGVGYDVISDLLHNHLGLAVVLSLLLVKAGIWIIALGSGTSGGVLAPLLMLGAGLGVVIAQLIPGSDPELWPVVCMAAVLAGVLGAPLTSAIFALGLTGDFNAMLPLLLATGVSYGFTVFAMRRSIMTEKIARRGLHIYREYSVDPLERVFAQDVMEKKLMTIEAGSTVSEVAQNYFGAVQKHRSFPVVDSQGQVVGILDRKLLEEGRASLGESADVATLFDGVTLHYALVTESCQVIGRRMAMHHLERLPVIADPGSMKLLGIISRSDLIKPSHGAFHEEHVRERLLDARLRKRS